MYLKSSAIYLVNNSGSILLAASVCFETAAFFLPITLPSLISPLVFTVLTLPILTTCIMALNLPPELDTCNDKVSFLLSLLITGTQKPLQIGRFGRFRLDLQHRIWCAPLNFIPTSHTMIASLQDFSHATIYYIAWRGYHKTYPTHHSRCLSKRPILLADKSPSSKLLYRHIRDMECGLVAEKRPRF